MKRLFLIILLVSIPTIYSAQTLSSGKTKQNASKEIQPSQATLFNEEENTVEIFVEIEVEEYYLKNQLKVNVNMGENYKSMLFEKTDLKMLGQVANEVKKMETIPDLLNYFSNEGFKIVHYSTFLMNGWIFNKIILSQRFAKK